MRYHQFLRLSTYRRYGIFVVTILLSYTAIQAYMNNKTIDQSIEEVKQKAFDQQQEIYRTQNFYLNYTATEYAAYFLWHESGQLFAWERLLRLKTRAEDEEDSIISIDENTAWLTPQDAWKFFLKTRLEELWF